MRFLSNVSSPLGNASTHLSSGQLGLDAFQESFSAQATHINTLTAMTAASAAFSLGRALGGSVLSQVLGGSLLRAGSWVSGFASEVLTFRGVNQVLNPGAESWLNSSGLLSTATDFLLLKGAGVLCGSSSILLRQAVQATAMVGGEYAGEALGVRESTAKNFSERYAHAFATGLALEVGGSLVRGVTAGRVDAFQRNLEGVRTLAVEQERVRGREEILSSMAEISREKRMKELLTKAYELDILKEALEEQRPKPTARDKAIHRGIINQLEEIQDEIKFYKKIMEAEGSSYVEVEREAQRDAINRVRAAYEKVKGSGESIRNPTITESKEEEIQALRREAERLESMNDVLRKQYDISPNELTQGLVRMNRLRQIYAEIEMLRKGRKNPTIIKPMEREEETSSRSSQVQEPYKVVDDPWKREQFDRQLIEQHIERPRREREEEKRREAERSRDIARGVVETVVHLPVNILRGLFGSRRD